jgi:hypothetical protein
LMDKDKKKPNKRLHRKVIFFIILRGLNLLLIIFQN